MEEDGAGGVPVTVSILLTEWCRMYRNQGEFHYLTLPRRSIYLHGQQAQATSTLHPGPAPDPLEASSTSCSYFIIPWTPSRLRLS